MDLQREQLYNQARQIARLKKRIKAMREEVLELKHHNCELAEREKAARIALVFCQYELANTKNELIKSQSKMAGWSAFEEKY